MKRNLLPLIGIAFVVAVATTGIFYGLVVGKLDANQAPQASLVIAARNLPPGAPITANDVKLLPWASKSIPKGAFDSPSQVLGQTTFDAISEGEILMSSRLANKSGGAGLAIPEGMRAVSTHITDSTGVLEMLRVGHKVDVQALPLKNEAGSEVRTILQNIPVLSIHAAPDYASNGGPAQPSVTLLVTPSEADILALADSTSRVRLALRNPADAAKETRSSLSTGALMRSSTK